MREEPGGGHTSTLIAHSENAKSQTQSLDEHLIGVARRAGVFAEPFGAAAAAYAAGLAHDLGKASDGFQEYVRGQSGAAHGPDHSSAGAIVLQKTGDAGDVLAWVAAAHHSGLPAPSDLKVRLTARATDAAVKAVLAQDGPCQELIDAVSALQPSLPRFVLQSASDPTVTEMCIRMLFSALVDADALDTEQHFSPDRSERRSPGISLVDLKVRFDGDQARLLNASTDVNRIRNEVYEAAISRAAEPPGFFSLTVPTGGGKTRTALGFALRHALTNDLSQIIVAIPYTSIIEQTAAVYRGILGDEAVVEHHSALPVETGNGDSDVDGMRLLATENWDAPLIVTTSVQLFESLFANRSSRCRKLHNLARSVVIVDEVQTLPTSLLAPIVAMLRELVAHYGVTVILSTATQPALSNPSLAGGLPEAIELAPDPPALFERLRRVRYELPFRERSWSWGDVALEMRAQRQALCVVNTKSDAMALLDALDDPEALHLSTLLCGCHRSAVIGEITKRLAAGDPCRVVATQVVEAGVDLDFPVVLRAMGPLDRIVQAAGRCNREGRLDAGRVIIFEPQDGSTPPGTFRTGTDIARNMLASSIDDPGDPAVFADYFNRLFIGADTDKEHIQVLRAKLDFPAVAERFRVIPDDSVPVIVTRAPPWVLDGLGLAIDPWALAAEATAGRLTRNLMRKLQPFLVSIRQREYQRLCREGLIGECIPDVLGVWEGVYDPVRGLAVGRLDPERLVII